MAIDFIIPAKATSTRVERKNWRSFYGRDCLVDLTILKLLAIDVAPNRIHVSCEDERTAEPVCERHGVQFIKRDESLCDNDVPLTDWMRTIVDQVPGDSDIGWAQVCDPLFDCYQAMISFWQSRPTHYDSIVACRPWRGYLLIDGRPVGWSFGEHHTPSQNLPELATMPFTFSILTRQAVRQCGYHVGRHPVWYTARGPHVDIDTLDDFEVARIWHERRIAGRGVDGTANRL